MTFERQLLAAIVHRRSLKKALDWGIRSDDFGTTHARAIFDLLLGWELNPANPGAHPSAASLEAMYPDFALVDDPDTDVAWYCQQVRRERIEREAKAVAEQLAGDVTGNPTPAVAQAVVALQALEVLGTGRAADVTFGIAVTSTVATYYATKAGLRAGIMSWPWEPLNVATGGIQPGDYNIFYGRPKSKKSWIMAYLAARAMDAGLRVLIYGKEMTIEDTTRRVAACLASLPYHQFRTGNLSKEDERSLELLKEMATSGELGELICLDGSTAGTGLDTPSWLLSKIEKHKPAIVFVDGIYLLSDDTSRKEPSDHIRVRNISRSLRAIALRTKVPIIGTMQANRRAASHGEGRLEEIAFSDALAQDGTLAIRTVPDKTGPYLNLVVAGSREFQLDGIRINAVPAVDFSLHSILSPIDAVTVRDNDRNPGKSASSVNSALADQNGLTRETKMLVDRHFKALGGRTRA